MPPTLYDQSGQQVTGIPEEEARKMVLEGRLGFQPGQKVMAVSPRGETFEFSPEDAILALKEGFRFEAPNEAFRREAEDKYGQETGYAALAGFAGAGRGVLPGFDFLMARSGLVDPQTLRGLKEAYPSLSEGFEVGSMAGSLVAPWGWAKAAGFLPRAISRGSLAIEKGAAGALGRLGLAEGNIISRSLARAVPLATGSAVEGAVYGGAQYLNETALGEREVVAEELLGAMGLGAVFGGGLGGGLGVGLEALATGARGLSALSRSTARGVVNVWERATGSRATQGLVDALTGEKGAANTFFGEGAAQDSLQAMSREVDLLKVKAAKGDFPGAYQDAVRILGVGNELRKIADSGLATGDTSALKHIAGLADDALRKISGLKVEAPESARALQGTLDGFADALQPYRKEKPSYLFGEGGKQARREATESRDVFKKGSQEVAQDFGFIRDALDNVTELITGSRKRMAMVGKIADDVYGAPLQQAALQTLSDMTTKLGEMKGASGTFGFQDKVQKLLKRAEAVTKKIGEADMTGEGVAGLIFDELDVLKRDIGKTVSRMNRVSREVANSADLATAEVAMKHYMDLRALLENADLVGKEAAEAQTAVNARWTELLSRKDHQPRYRFERMTGQTPWEDMATFKGNLEFTPDPAEFLKFLEDLADPRSALDKEWLLRQNSKIVELLETSRKYYAMDDGVKAQIDEAVRRAKRFEGNLKEYERKATFRTQLKDIEEGSRRSGFGSAIAGGAVGFLVGGVPGALMGGALGSLFDPGTMIRRLATIDRVADTFRSRINLSLDSYLEQAKKAGAKGARALKTTAAAELGKAAGRDAFAGKTREEKRAAYKSTMDHLARLSSNQPYREEQARRALEPIAKVAPQVAQAVQATAARAADYLLKVAPKRGMEPGLFKGQTMPSDTELAEFASVKRTVEHPETLLEDLTAGRLRASQVKALQEVYPRTYERIAMTLLERADEIAETLPYSQRVQWSVMFGVPLDKTMDPSFVATIQQAHQELSQAREEVAQGGGGALPRTTTVQQGQALNRMTSPRNSATRAQAVAFA